MRSPGHAILWETWRVSRVEAAWRFAVGIVGGLAAVVVSAAFAPNERAETLGAVIAMVLLNLPHFVGWLSLPMLNGGRPGFPLDLLYTRPVRTAAIVGLPMAYLTAVSAAIYLASALLLRVISGHPFPLLPVAAWIAALNLAYLAVKWSTRSRVATTLGAIVVSTGWILFAEHRTSAPPDGFEWQDSTKLWPTIFDFPLTDYALIALVGLASFWIAVATVARQRCGNARAAVPWAGAGFPEWLVNLFRLSCPTSSATRAQVWFELKSRGLPLLTIGVALAIVNPLLFAVSGPLDALFGGSYFALYVLVFSTLSVLAALVLGANVFGLRWRQGGTYAGFFGEIQPYATTQLAGLKVLVRSVCVLTAIMAVGVSVWTSHAFIPLRRGDKHLIEPLSSWQSAIESAVGALTGYEQLALAFVAAIGVLVWVAAFAVLGALWTRYSRRMNTAASLLLLCGLALALLGLAGRSGILSPFLVDALFGATRWIATAAAALATVYLFWSGFAGRLLTVRYACVAVAISAAFGAAWLTALHGAGVQLDGMSATDAVGILWPVLLPLMASVLAPWSLDRLRHM